ncbi:hypothetical protein T492DRAFT_1150670 [Pavlovales sp. CCMP2436]|nr:hypothetical protein T492DRAFT_1150670 [Pavlovales sp. CCMP2436]
MAPTLKSIRDKFGGPEFKARVRDMKNQVLDYTEAEKLVREVTCNSPDPVNPVLCRGVVKYVRSADWPAIVAILTKRLTVGKNANHPWKVMQLIEILLNETSGSEHEAVWRDVIIQNTRQFDELKHFNKVVDGLDTGSKVRPLALKLIERIRAEQHRRDDAALGIPSSTGPASGQGSVSVRPPQPAARPSPPPPAAAAKPPPPPPKDLAPNLLEFDLLSLDAPQQQPVQQPVMAQQAMASSQQSVQSGPIWGGPPQQGMQGGGMMGGAPNPFGGGVGMMGGGGGMMGGGGGMMGGGGGMMGGGSGGGLGGMMQPMQSGNGGGMMGGGEHQQALAVAEGPAPGLIAF